MKNILFTLAFLVSFSSFGQTYEVKTTYDRLSNSSKSTIKEKISPYGRNKSLPNIKPFTPNYNMFRQAVEARKIRKTQEKKESDKWIKDYIKAHNSKYNSRNNAASLKYANLIRNYHKSLIKSTLLPKPGNASTSEEFYSDVVVIVKWPSFYGKTNSMGTQVYNAKAYYSYNKKLKLYEIFNIFITDENYTYEKNIFKKNHKWDISDRRTKLQLSRPCQSSSNFLYPMIINFNGKISGGFQSLYIDSECINRLGQRKANYPIEVYFIEDLEYFARK